MMIIVDIYFYVARRKEKKELFFLLILDKTFEWYDKLCLYSYILIMNSIQGGNGLLCNVGVSRIIGNGQNQSSSMTLFAH